LDRYAELNFHVDVEAVPCLPRSFEDLEDQVEYTSHYLDFIKACFAGTNR